MKIFTGKVIAIKNKNTATVAVDRFIAHPIYKKRLKRTTKFQVHDTIGVSVKQVVQFVACAPVSKTKKWKIIETQSKASRRAEKVSNSKVEVKAEETKSKVTKTKKAAVKAKTKKA